MAGCDSCRKNASSHSWPRRIFRLFSFILVLLLVYLLLVAFNFEWVRRAGNHRGVLRRSDTRRQRSESEG
eukprot:s8578_g1.t1